MSKFQNICYSVVVNGIKKHCLQQRAGTVQMLPLVPQSLQTTIDVQFESVSMVRFATLFVLVVAGFVIATLALACEMYMVRRNGQLGLFVYVTAVFLAQTVHQGAVTVQRRVTTSVYGHNTVL